jgi:hypothetical protein
MKGEQSVRAKTANPGNLVSGISLLIGSGLRYSPIHYVTFGLLPKLLSWCYRCDRRLRQLGQKRVLLLAL